MQIKITRYYLTLVRVALSKKIYKNKHWRGCRENGTLQHCWWECKLVVVQCVENSAEVP